MKTKSDIFCPLLYCFMTTRWSRCFDVLLSNLLADGLFVHFKPFSLFTHSCENFIHLFPLRCKAFLIVHIDVAKVHPRGVEPPGVTLRRALHSFSIIDGVVHQQELGLKWEWKWLKWCEHSYRSTGMRPIPGSPLGPVAGFGNTGPGPGSVWAWRVPAGNSWLGLTGPPAAYLHTVWPSPT